MALIRRFPPPSKGAGQQGVVLLAFGGPEALDEVPSFLSSVIGRLPPASVEHEVVERYRELGGRSPLPQTTRLQAALLRSELGRRRFDWSVYVGMLHARPFIEEAVEEMARDGITDLVAISMTPYRAAVSTGSYERRLRQMLAKHGMEPHLRLPPDWHLHPLYLEGLADVLRGCLNRIPQEERPTSVVFTAHSLPVSAVEAGDPYADQLRATAEALAEGLDLEDWRLGYQSVSSVAKEPWLGPEVEEVLDELKGTGRRSAVVYPIGFLADHLETLYDNDIVHREHAERIGLAFYRPPCLNEHPLLIQALADLAIATAAGH
ncbi:MAG: ferrochelatase [Actinomycetota bacterium]|nr:ferrochelatase [Actinomycetota bacterium]